MIKNYITLLLLLLGSIVGVQAQLQGDVWFFGDSVLLDFSQGAPTVGTAGRMTSDEGSSALCTAEGRLLLYTNGLQLRDSTNQIFRNWTPPNNSYYVNHLLVNGSLLLPINDSIIYFFAISGSPSSSSHNGIFYARINLNANNGQGWVEASHINIGDSTTENMVAVRDATNEGWWLLSHTTWSDKFIKWHIDRAGNITKSFQAVGNIHPQLFVFYNGQMVLNEQGNRLATASDQGRLDYFSFDRCSGNLALLNTIDKPREDTNVFFGISFSPNGRLLYGSDGTWGFNPNGTDTHLYQYEMDSVDILATERVIWTTQDCDSCRRGMSHHKLGPDGKIYLYQIVYDYNNHATSARDTIMVINNPNGLGQACNFDPYAMSISPGKTRGGLPNIPNYRMKPIVAQVAEAGPNILLCGGDSVQIGVADTSNGRLTFQWWPVTGLSDPNAAQPMASPSQATTYYLTVTDTALQIACNSTIDSVTVSIVDPLLAKPIAGAGRDTLVCAGEAVVLGNTDTSGGAWSYLWTPSMGLNDPNIAQPISVLSTSNQYVLHVFREGIVGTCQEDFDTVLVSIYDASIRPQNPAGPDQIICSGDTVLLGIPSVGFDYSWTGNNLSNATVAQPFVSASSSAGYVVVLSDPIVDGPCRVSRDTAFVTVEQPFVHDAPSDQSFCIGECFMLGVAAQSGLTYSWSPNLGLESPALSWTRAQPAASTIYTLTIVNSVMQSANCREQSFVVNASADACNYQSFIAVNGDGIAQVLDFGDHAAAVSLQVFDLQGRLVFEDSDYRNAWNAAELAHGVYVYRVVVSGTCGTTFVGKILVLR